MDEIGNRYGKLLVISKGRLTKSGNQKWICRCDCGNSTEVIGSKLRSGYTKSCGCLRSNAKACGYSKTRLYRIWCAMYERCNNPKHDAFKWYGEKGVKICNDWNSFIAFREWSLNNGYNESLSIDRIDSNGNYEPNNCRWQTQKQQMNNVSSNRIIEYQGKMYTRTQFCEKFGIKYHTLVNRMRAEWSIEMILASPERSIL